MIENGLYKVKFRKENDGIYILENISRDLFSASLTKKISKLYKEYYNKDYPSFTIAEDYVFIHENEDELRYIFTKDIKNLCKQKYDKRIDDTLKEFIGIIENSSKDNIFYLIYKNK